MYVTLEPCCHQGKTGPCTRALIDAGIKRVVVGLLDPSPHCAGQGVAELRAAGVAVESGLLEREVRRVTAPFLKLVETGLPYVHAKWAMTLDGKIATRSGSSRWISNERSREIVHRLRGRMDAIIIGAGTARHDDPLLTARPPGPRTPTRIVLTAQADLSVESQLARTAEQAPVLIATSQNAREDDVRRLQSCGVEVLRLPGVNIPNALPARQGLDLRDLLAELGRRRMTNVLIEGGPSILGFALDSQLIDEVHVFLAPKLFGGAAAPSALAGIGIGDADQALRLDGAEIEIVEGDVYVHGRVRYRADCEPE
jgi:diaminohydroxyphosphoribosylaminopyrimidine deaminase/5-amino-6-(5-phosphoribosylamino)uracil reductase